MAAVKPVAFAKFNKNVAVVVVSTLPSPLAAHSSWVVRRAGMPCYSNNSLSSKSGRLSATDPIEIMGRSLWFEVIPGNSFQKEPFHTVEFKLILSHRLCATSRQTPAGVVTLIIPAHVYIPSSMESEEKTIGSRLERWEGLTHRHVNSGYCSHVRWMPSPARQPWQ